MSPSRIFILRPVATILIMVAILIAGGIAYKLLPLSALPEVDFPTIQVVTLYPGASADIMAATVTAPLEKQFGQMSGLNQMSSSSAAGASMITLQFSLGLNLDVAEQTVQAAINAASTFLPSDLPTPPIYSKVNPADAPIFTLAVTSDALNLPQIQDLVDTRVAQKISQVSGVGLVTLSGGQRPAVRIQVNPNALAAYGLTMEDVRSAINTANSTQAKGSFDGPLRASTIDANDQLRTALNYREMVLAYRNGAPIRLSDVAVTVDGAENTRLAAWNNTTPAILLNIQRQPGANVIEVADRIHKLLPKLQQALPNSLHISFLSDRTQTIRASVKDVEFELIMAIALVVMVIFLFLRTFAATLIPSIAVPLSLVGTFGVMYLAGFSINNLTLMAMTIATGFVVDDAIVMIENIARYIEAGETPLQAALKGAKQIGFTIVSLTISLIAVLIPLLFMGDVVGRLFREFAITLAVSILISAFISLTLTPMLSARLLRIQPEKKQSLFYRKTGFIFDKIIHFYGRCLTVVLKHQPLVLLITVGTIALTIFLVAVIPKGFFPLQDTGMLYGASEAPQSISFREMGVRQQALVEQVLNDPAVESISSFVGVDGVNSTLNTGRLLINLVPIEQRKVDAAVIIRRLNEKLNNIEGIKLHLQPVQDLSIEDRVSAMQYQYSASSPNLPQLNEWVPKIVAAFQTLPELMDVGSDLQQSGDAVEVEIDRDAASRYGVTVADISNAFYNAFGQRQISTIFTQTTQYRVILELSPQFQQGPEALQSIYLKSSATGQKVPLSAMVQLKKGVAPLTINHLAQFPVATISFNLAPGVSLGEAEAAIEREEKLLEIPVSIQTQFQGTALALQSSLQNELLLIIAAIVTMYIVLGILYESFIHPLTILSTLPSAGAGALLAMLFTKNNLDVIAIIGIILLIGIVKKNAIMMIDFALDAERNQNFSPRDAIYQACLLRFRPILMTTLAALLSALPLMLSSGAGSELRRPLGIVLVGGLLVSQILTLFTTPVVYLAFDRFTRKKSIDLTEEMELLKDETQAQQAEVKSSSHSI